ncbi:MAG: hypothetical protein EA357_09905 [Micavibrio sp.]|nr:MAG: hypothetical protein EA357_09905 [Micavibrio sp.]
MLHLVTISGFLLSQECVLTVLYDVRLLRNQCAVIANLLEKQVKQSITLLRFGKFWIAASLSLLAMTRKKALRSLRLCGSNQNYKVILNNVKDIKRRARDSSLRSE